MRILLFVLALAVPVAAGPGSWTALEHGESARAPADEGRTSGNASQMRVHTGPFVAAVQAFAITDTLSADQTGAGSGCTTNWYSLVFTGSPAATDHRWRISTTIYGLGNGTADGLIDGAAAGECVLAIEFSGDHQNAACGQLAVDDEGGAVVNLSVPPGFRVTLQKSARAKGTDVYEVDSPKTTVGAGRACRVRVCASAEARVSAQSFFGIASVHLIACLHGDLVMTGTCRIGEVRVEDRFSVEKEIPDHLQSAFEPPSGGVEPGEIDPPDTPTGEERTGEVPGVSGSEDPVDAEDVPTVPEDEETPPDPRAD